MMTMEMTNALETIGCVTGLAGSALLALRTRYSGYGFVAFLASNLAWMGYGVQTNAWGLVTMQAGFTVTTVLGLWRWRPFDLALFSK